MVVSCEGTQPADVAGAGAETTQHHARMLTGQFIGGLAEVNRDERGTLPELVERWCQAVANANVVQSVRATLRQFAE